MIFRERCYNDFEGATEVPLLLVLLRGGSSTLSTLGLRLRDAWGAFTCVAERDDLVFEAAGFRSAANTTAWHHPPSGPH